jgi:hypothetical protein
MAIVRTIRNPYYATAAVYEDPTPSSPYIFFQHDAYNKTTLAPQYDVSMNWNTTGFVSYYNGLTGVNHSGFGFSLLFGTNQASGASSTATYNIPLTGVLQLNGETTHVRHNLFNTTNSYLNNLDVAPFASMDDTRKCKPMNYFTDGTNNVVIGVAHVNDGATAGTPSISTAFTKYWVKNNTNYTDLVNSQCVQTNSVIPLTTINTVNSGTLGYPDDGYQVWPVYRNPVTGNLVWAGQGAQHSGGTSAAVQWTPSAIRGIASSPAFNGAPAFACPSGSGGNQSSSQFVGVSSLDGYAIYMQNSQLNDYTQTFYKFNDSSTTNTTLNTFSSAPTAAGSSAGGNRAATAGGYQCKYASKVFAESATVKGFYVPYLDSTGNYCPFYFQWNTTTDVFTRNSDVTITYPGSNTLSNYWTPETSSALSVSTGVVYGMQRLYANETFTYSGTRYLLFMQLLGIGGISDASTTQRTFVCYSVNASNPKLLTYHSSIVVPTTPKNIVWLNDARTVLGVIAHNNLYIFTFNGTTWTQTSNLQYQFHAVGRDNMGRIWAVDAGSGAGRIHLISSTVPVTISVVPAAGAYQYTGSPLSSSLTVNAYDSTGARIATSIKLVIDGASMTFSGSNLTTTVTTSASADTTVAVTITGGGVNNIIASAAV